MHSFALENISQMRHLTNWPFEFFFAAKTKKRSQKNCQLREKVVNLHLAKRQIENKLYSCYDLKGGRIALMVM